MTDIPESPWTFPHLIMLRSIVSIWSSAWCAVRIYLPLYFERTCSRKRYLSCRAIASSEHFSFFAIRKISTFSISHWISLFLQKFATKSLSPSDSAPRSEWSKWATMTFSCGWNLCTRSRRTILSTPPLTARMRISLGWIILENVWVNASIFYFLFNFLTNSRNSSSSATLLSISFLHFSHRWQIISHLFFL